MFIFSIVIFTFLGVGVAGLFWFYIFSTLTISLTNYKKGLIYSFAFLITPLIIYFFTPSLLTNKYDLSLIIRFSISYIVLNVLFLIIEHSRQKTQKDLYKTLYKLQDTNEQLTSADEELRLRNEELYLLNKKISENEIRLKLAQKVGEIGIWEWDVEKNEVIWTDTTYKIFDIENNGNTISSNEYFKYVHEDDKDRLIKELDISLKNNVKIHKTEYRILKNNEIRYIEEIAEIIKNEQGRLIKMIGVLQDITEREKAITEIKEKNEELSSLTEDLRQNNEEPLTVKEEIEDKNKLLNNLVKKYNLISSSISDLIWMLSFDMKPLYISPSCEKFIGYSLKELQTINLADFHTQKSLKLVNKLIENTKTLRNRSNNIKGITTEIDYIHKDGRVITAEVKAFLIFDNNKAVAVGGVSRDITKRKETEKALEESNKKIALAHKDVLDNFKYAKTIQDALLTRTELIDSLFKNYFLLYKQRFSVGGDFYYVNKVNNSVIFAVGDCTGHGVSGGLLSMIAITYLHEIMRHSESLSPGSALTTLRKRFIKTYSNRATENFDGFNIALCIVDTRTNIMQFSGAYHPVTIIRDNEAKYYKGTRNPIGLFFKEKEFTTTNIHLKTNDKIYLFSDGYYDQVNPEGKKIGIKKFKQLLIENCNLPFNEQKKALSNYLSNWRQNFEQIDDITVMGINWE